MQQFKNETTITYFFFLHFQTEVSSFINFVGNLEI